MRGRDVPKQELDNRSLLWYGYLNLVTRVYGYIFQFIYSCYLGEPD
uniref:Uncharacterized protein n=1 Tax=Arundo donax TaxID=35708 RepID=A0A0A9FAI1_ARUDO